MLKVCFYSTKVSKKTMKKILIGLVIATNLTSCNAITENKTMVSSKITAINYEQRDFKETHIGKEYRFTIDVDNKDDLEILDFCK